MSWTTVLTGFGRRVLSPLLRSDRTWLVLSLLLLSFVILRIVPTRHYWPRRDSGEYTSGVVSISRGLGRRLIRPLGLSARPSPRRSDPTALPRF